MRNQFFSDQSCKKIYSIFFKAFNSQNVQAINSKNYSTKIQFLKISKLNSIIDPTGEYNPNENNLIKPTRILFKDDLVKLQKMAKSKYEYVRENEDHLDRTLLSDCYTVIRIDGSRFHHFSSEHNYIKPNDKRALDLMNEAALYVVKLYFPNIICAYGQSDEYSFILSPKSGLFNRRSNKLNSMIVSAFSSAFVFNWSKYFGCPVDRRMNNRINVDKKIDSHETQSNHIDERQINGSLSIQPEKGHLISRPSYDELNKPEPSKRTKNEFKEFIELKYPPTFDSRCVLYSTVDEIKDYLRWRQVDCHINNLYNTAFYALTGKYSRWWFESSLEVGKYRAEIIELEPALTPQQAENRLRGTVSKEKREDILKGMFNIDYELEMEQFRRGSFIVFDKKDEHMYEEYHRCLLNKRKKQLDKFNLDDFINFQILHQELIQSDYLDNYLSKIESFVK